MKKFRKRNKGESLTEYLGLIIIVYWPFSVLTQLILSGLSCWIYWVHLGDIKGILAIIIVMSGCIFIIMSNAAIYHYKIKRLIDALDLDRMGFAILLYNLGLIFCIIYGLIIL